MHAIQVADELFTPLHRPCCQSFGFWSISSSSYCTTERLPARTFHSQYSKYCSEVRNTPESLEAESPFWQPLPLLDVPRDEIIDHIRPPLCLNLSPVVGIGFSALNTQSSISSTGNSTRKIPLQKYAAQATTVAISASIQ